MLPAKNRTLLSTRPKTRRGLPRFVPAIVVAAVVAGGLWVWQQRGAGSTEDAWRTTPVERGDIRVVISATGTLSATSTVTVGSQISGLITEVLVDFNDTATWIMILAMLLGRLGMLAIFVLFLPRFWRD